MVIQGFYLYDDKLQLTREVYFLIKIVFKISPVNKRVMRSCIICVPLKHKIVVRSAQPTNQQGEEPHRCDMKF
jgi:hypothetical protein